jgi:hypothetical protein
LRVLPEGLYCAACGRIVVPVDDAPEISVSYEDDPSGVPTPRVPLPQRLPPHMVWQLDTPHDTPIVPADRVPHDCPQCDATGRVGDDVCPLCDGTALVTAAIAAAYSIRIARAKLPTF